MLFLSECSLLGIADLVACEKIGGNIVFSRGADQFEPQYDHIR